MANLTVLISIIAFVFLCAYMFFKLGDNKINNKNHFLLQLLLLFFILSSVMLLGKVTLDDANYCDILLINETDVTLGSQCDITYEYDYVCFDNDNTTALTFYKVCLWFMRIFALYIFIYFTYEVLIYMNWVVPK